MKKGKLVSLISLLMANMIGLSLVTFAWYTTNQRTKKALSDLITVKENIVKNYNFYPFSSTQRGSKTEYYFSKTPVETKDLGKYSIISSGYQVLVEIELYDYMSIDVTASTTADSYLGDVSLNEEGKPIYTLQEKGNSLSSIVCFYGFDYTHIFEANGDYQVILENSNGGKKNLVNDDYTDLIEGKKNSICTINNTNKFYVVIDYDEVSIEHVYSANIGNDITSGGGDDMTTDEEGHTYIEYVADFSINVTKALEAD